jgi:hypothetical protein
MHPEKVVEELSNYFARGIPSDREGIESVNISDHRAKKANRLASRVGNPMVGFASKVGELMARHAHIRDTGTNAAELNAAHLTDTVDNIERLVNQNIRLHKLGQAMHPDNPAKKILLKRTSKSVNDFVDNKQEAEAKYNREI